MPDEVIAEIQAMDQTISTQIGSVPVKRSQSGDITVTDEGYAFTLALNRLADSIDKLARRIK